MVLDNASASNSSDAFADSAPSSDADPYSDSQPDASMNYHIDARKFPQPIPIIGKLLGYNEQFYSKSIQARVKTISEILERPPTQEEATAIAYYTTKSISIYSYGAPLGFAAGLWRAYESRSTFRFPFYQPNPEKFTPDRFPPGLGFIKGIRAIACWHAARASGYAAMGIIFSQIIFVSYAATTSAVGELSDKRLKAVTAAIQARAQKQRGALPGMQGTTKLPNGGQPAGTQHDSKDGLSQDDASPTGGIFEEENTAGSSGTFGGSIGGSTQSKGQWAGRGAPLPVQQRSEETDAQPFDAWDDASPTGDQGVKESTASTPHGSAWDRVRRGEKAAPIPSKSGRRPQSNQSPWARQQNETQKEQKEGSTMGDSFAFSKTEEERTYAKEEAQKEFDARVERERSGGNFSKGDGDQRRW
ncbi:hypothetical protein N431DRAFT_436319 [Stipitochalara longipes BDJ]|nr:hypothetical protein N431DRAFT_436319 [Stipitochalara longipes BDJ]